MTYQVAMTKTSYEMSLSNIWTCPPREISLTKQLRFTNEPRDIFFEVEYKYNRS